MSAWRRVAIEKIPRFRRLVEESESVWMLWLDLWGEFVKAHREPIDAELIGQIYEYAWWCVNSRDAETRTAGALSFYEDLPNDPGVRKQMARWLSAERFQGMGEIFRYHLDTYAEYKRFVHEFYEQRQRLGESAAQSSEPPLTDEQFQARVSEAVAVLKEGIRARGSLSWEFLARATIIDNKAVMQHLAPAVLLCKGSTDAMAAAITPVLRSLVASGAVPFPADSGTIAAAALILAARRPS